MKREVLIGTVILVLSGAGLAAYLLMKKKAAAQAAAEAAGVTGTQAAPPGGTALPSGGTQPYWSKPRDEERDCPVCVEGKKMAPGVTPNPVTGLWTCPQCKRTWSWAVIPPAQRPERLPL